MTSWAILIRWRAAIGRILEHIGVSMPEAEIARRWAPESFDPSRSHTFRRGDIGGWREAFTPAHEAAFKSVAGELLIELGYATDLSWSAGRETDARVPDRIAG